MLHPRDDAWCADRWLREVMPGPIVWRGRVPRGRAGGPGETEEDGPWLAPVHPADREGSLNGHLLFYDNFTGQPGFAMLWYSRPECPACRLDRGREQRTR